MIPVVTSRKMPPGQVMLVDPSVLARTRITASEIVARANDAAFTAFAETALKQASTQMLDEMMKSVYSAPMIAPLADDDYIFMASDDLVNGTWDDSISEHDAEQVQHLVALHSILQSTTGPIELRAEAERQLRLSGCGAMVTLDPVAALGWARRFVDGEIPAPDPHSHFGSRVTG